GGEALRKAGRGGAALARLCVVRHVRSLRAPGRGLHGSGEAARVMPRKLVPDMWLAGTAIVLLSIGVVMVYSASAIVAAERFRDPYFFLRKQVFWAGLGCIALWLALRTDYRRLERWTVPLVIGALVLLVLVLIPPLGQAINGTRRWIRMGPVSFQ